MPSPEEASSSALKTRKYKRRKIQKERACDYCRRKKIKCDGPLRSDSRCSKCISRNVECTYVEPFVRHDYPNSYVESLEHRVQKLEKLLKKHCPEVDLTIEEEGASDSEPSPHPAASPSPADSTPSQTSFIAPTSARLVRTSPLSAMAPPSPAKLDDYETSDEDDVAIQNDIVEDLSRLSLDPVTRQYHGKSSGLMFVRTAMRLMDNPPSKTWPRPAGEASSEERTNERSKRDDWVEPLPQAELPPFEDFPPEDLMTDLISLFFSRLNVYTPLLHKPTFTEGLEKGQHLKDGGFGATVLLVCAIGSGFSDDPRVLMDGNGSKTSAGWKWFLQVEAARKSLMAPTRLYDLQICALMALFLHGTRFTQHIWTLTGLGVRKGLEVGAHRKQTGSSTLTVEDELRRRAFWVLVNLDWGFSHAFGRPHIIGDEDMDVPLPTECDDAYWMNGFQQPPGKPSQISYFNCYIRLSRIIAFATRTIYAIGRSRARFGNGDHLWRQRIVAELDSLLNQWADSVPDHLKWDPQRSDELFFRQSACLHAYFYLVQICVHRPFILPHHESPLSFPSLIICTNSARSCIRLLEQVNQRLGTPIAYNMGALHLSCLILFFKRWSNKRTGHSPEQDQDLDYIQRCIRLIETSRIESAMAERLLESISAILAADPSSAASSARKQDHKPDVEVEARTANVSASDTVCTDSNDVPSGDSRNGKVLDAEASYNPSVFTFPQGSLPSSEQPNTGFFDMPPGHIENNATGFGMDIDAPFTLPLHMEELCRVPTGSFGTLPVPGWAAPHSADGQAPQSATTQGLPFDYYSFLQQSGMYSGEGQGFGHAGPSHEYGMQEGGSTGYMGGSVEGGSHQLPHDLPSFSIDFSSLDMPPLEDHTFGATEGEASDELRDILGPFR